MGERSRGVARYHADIAMEDRRVWINREGFSEMVFCQWIFFLSVIDHAKAVPGMGMPCHSGKGGEGRKEREPCVVMTRVDTKSSSEGGKRGLKIIHCHVFVSS